MAQNFDFYGKTLPVGRKCNRVGNAVSTVNGVLGEAVGQKCIPRNIFRLQLKNV